MAARKHMSHENLPGPTVVYGDSPCPCGSKVALFDCCAKDEPWFGYNLKPIKPTLEYQRAHGMGKPLSSQKVNNLLLTAVGNELVIFNAEQTRTFLNFLSGYFAGRVGNDWGRAEDRKPFDEMHELAKWARLLKGRESGFKGDPQTPVKIQGNGAMHSWYQLAYDFFLIKQNHKLQTMMLERLRNPNSFQGARCELQLTAGMIAGGFQIEYEDESQSKNKHAEFVAVSKSGVRIAVEAKSKHREGIMGYTRGGRFKGMPRSDALNIDGLIDGALEKNPGMPFFAFIELNRPEKDLDVGSLLRLQLEASVEKARAKYPVGEFPVNAFFFYNDASPYFLDEVLPVAPTRILCIAPSNPKFLIHLSLIQFACFGMDKRRRIPQNFPQD